MKNVIYFLIAGAAMFFLLTSELNFSSGSPGGKTGSPGDGGNTCTDCHGGSANPAEGWITSNIPAEGYTPGMTYTVTATGTHSGVVKFGFEATAEDAQNQKTGTLIVTNSVENQLINGGQSITHKSSGTTPTGNTKSWSFDWTAPNAGTGTVTFYAAFNAANGNGNTSGDIIYTSNLTIPEASGGSAGLTVNFTEMTPHIGELFEARLIDKATLMEVERMALDEIPGPEFSLTFSNFTDGGSYWLDFYADHNDNGYYDGIPTDHAWRLTFNNLQSGTEHTFIHNTNFSEIMWKHMYIVEFHDMTPHIGEKLEIRLVEQLSGMEAGRATVEAIPGDEFEVELPYLVSMTNYYVDFYADHNGNGVYDAPPTDHAWRFELTDVEGDEDDDFFHNTNFTDIGWNYRFTLNASEMTPHLGELFELRLVNQSTLEEAGRVSLDSIVLPDFNLMATGLELGEDYFVDFYADHNGNGVYDPPPTDHAWRLELTSVAGDSELDFTHNTNFTDIQWPLTGLAENYLAQQINTYPNPASDYLNVDLSDIDENSVTSVSVYNLNGMEFPVRVNTNNEILKLNIRNLDPGIYFLTIQFNGNESIAKRIIKN
ncbi:MAG: hypothetical protein Kow00127_24310 [Bacteroidales bacterium]